MGGFKSDHLGLNKPKRATRGSTGVVGHEDPPRLVYRRIWTFMIACERVLVTASVYTTGNHVYQGSVDVFVDGERCLHQCAPDSGKDSMIGWLEAFGNAAERKGTRMEADEQDGRHKRKRRE